MNYDPNGKYYFYNAEGQSVWDLPDLFADDEDDEGNQQHFNKNFDDDLSTFKNLYTRLSTRQLTPQQQQQQQQQHQHQQQATSQSYQHVDNKKSNAPVISGPIAITNIQSVPGTVTTINYAYKPPTGLSAQFKCVKLAENGKRTK